jgi:hypothetical protein
MARRREQDELPSPDQPYRAVLFEVTAEQLAEEGNKAAATTEIFAALSMEEVIAYVRGRQPSVEIKEVKVLGKAQVLSRSEHLL